MSKQHHHLYNNSRWVRRRKNQLQLHPLCAKCEAAGRITLATVADHIRPHGGDLELFWDPENLQSLCASCHNSFKKSFELLGYDKYSVDETGWPTDPLHPTNRKHS
jgi:5-methylcytosine-specific restriction protein A